MKHDKVITCGSMPVHDGVTKEQIGWWYGTHFVEGKSVERCPHCGLYLNIPSPPQSHVPG